MARRRKRGGGDVAETIRRTILESGKTLYRVAKDSGVNFGTLYRFMSRERSMSLDAVEKLCAYLGLTLTRK
jgi:transcriptional regulator with XRE-family HTH domain